MAAVPGTSCPPLADRQNMDEDVEGVTAIAGAIR